MKKLLLLLVCLFSLQTMHAQLEDGSICPNFTGTDINGTSYTLYDILDQGKTVVVDVSATWCGPCWSYHQTHALDSIFVKYGPTGTDEMFVLWVEGDANTGMADLQGTTSGSQGDWITGTTFPIIDDAAIGNTLQIAYYPTIYMICPNRIVTEVGQASESAIYAAAQGCPAQTQGIDMSMLTSNVSPSFCQGGDFTPNVTLQNNGTTPITAASIETWINGSLINTDTWTGSLNTYDLASIDLTTLTGLSGSNAAIYRVIVAGDAQLTNDEIQETLVESTNETEVVIDIAIMTDNYASETGWELTDGTGNVVASRPIGSYTANNTLEITNVTLAFALECYTFKILDGYGDGMCCQYGNGFYEIRDANTSNVVFSGGQFTDEESTLFTNSALVGLEDAPDNMVRIYPTITNGEIKVELNQITEAGFNMTVMNTLGQVMQQRKFDNPGVYEVNLSQHAAGIYTVLIQSGEYSSVQKIILE